MKLIRPLRLSNNRANKSAESLFCSVRMTGRASQTEKGIDRTPWQVWTVRAGFLLLAFQCLVLVLDAQKPVNQKYPPDVPPSPNFRTNRNSYSAIMDVLRPS